MSDLNDLSQIRSPQPGDPSSAKVHAQPIEAIKLRLRALEEFVLAFSSESQGNFIIKNVAIKTGTAAVAVNDVVYYNQNTGLYEKALATVTFVSGNFAFNPSALAIGICVAVNSGKGDILIAGYKPWTGDAHKASMIESTEDFVPGVPYYLSDKEAGKLTRFAPGTRIQVLMATNDHYILHSSYSIPEAVENIYKTAVGMRPVGSLRSIGPDYEDNIIVGFDALENYDTVQNKWRLSRDGTVVNHQKFGFAIADATVTKVPAFPIYIRLQVAATSGLIKVFSADTLAALEDTNVARFNEITSLTALSSNKDTLRIYEVLDKNNVSLGNLTFKFTDNDVVLARHVIFKFPDAFQGWKMIHSPITPLATAIVAGGLVTGITVIDGSVGYLTAPVVILTGGGGTGATATAVLNEFGSIISVVIDAPGTGYTSAPTVTFDSRLTSIQIDNGGSGATATLGQTSGVVTTATLTAGGTGYVLPPSMEIIDTTGPGVGAQVVATVRNGSVVAVEIVDGGTGYVTPVVRILPSGNAGYQKTKIGVFTVNMAGATIDTVTVTDGGFNYPKGATIRTVGGSPTLEAVLVPVFDPINPNGVIISITVINGGTGYGATPTLDIDLKDPRLFLTGGDPITPGTGAAVVDGMFVDSILVTSSGAAYGVNTTVVATGGRTGGADATFRPIIEGGRIIRVDVTSRGSGYYTTPSLVIADPATTGNNAVLTPVLGTEIISATVDTAGTGYQELPEAQIGVPVSHVEVDAGGVGYVVAPAVTFSAPEDPDGVTATGVAVLGAAVVKVDITAGGTGYSTPSGATVVFSGGGGTGASAKPVFSGGVLIGIELLAAGSGYTSAPGASISGGGGSGATLTTVIQGTGAVVRIDVTRQGRGYVEPPTITIAASPTLINADASAYLVGGGAAATPNISGYGGSRIVQAAPLLTGNNLQIASYNDDLNDSASIIFTRPTQAAFYYNIKADPLLKLRYPPVPLDKATFVENGNELLVSTFNESSGAIVDPDADVVLSRKTIFWSTFNIDGSPWDKEWQQYVLDLASSGRDHVIPNSGPAGYQDSWWRLWEHVFKYEAYRNRGWMHINRASKFHQSSRVMSLAVNSPLRLIDQLTGVDSKSNGAPMTGQLLIVLDNQVNLFEGTLSQADLTKAGELVTIWQNTYGRAVLISSISLVVVFQKNVEGLSPTVSSAATVTIGTQEGSYRDIIGNIVPGQASQQGVSTKLYASNQAKELFPDSYEATPLIQPHQKVYLKVDAPAGSPILSQLVVARIKGHLL